MRPVETLSSVPLRDEVSWTTGVFLILLVKKVSRSVGTVYHHVCRLRQRCGRVDAWVRRVWWQFILLTFIAYCFSLLAYCFGFCYPLLIIFILLWFSTSQLVNKSITVAGVYFLFIVAEEL